MPSFSIRPLWPDLVHGGLQVLNEKGDDGWLIANAIIVVSIDDSK